MIPHHYLSYCHCETTCQGKVEAISHLWDCFGIALERRLAMTRMVKGGGG